LLAGSFTGLTWNGVGLSATRKRLLSTARIDGNCDGNVDHPERPCGDPGGTRCVGLRITRLACVPL